MRTWIIAAIALCVGAIGGYVYKQGEVRDLAERVSALETELAGAGEKAAGAAASEIERLKADLEATSKLAEEQQAKITDLETALKNEAPSPQP